jgi:hypothetical protein
LDDGQLYLFQNKKNTARVYQLHIQSGQLADIDDDMYYNIRIFKKLFKDKIKI